MQVFQRWNIYSILSLPVDPLHTANDICRTFHSQLHYFSIHNIRLVIIIVLYYFRTALAFWLLMNLLLVVVPRYGAYAMASLGVILCAAAGGYWASIPHSPLIVKLDGAILFFTLGWCFWLVLFSGKIFGFTLYFIDKTYSKLIKSITDAFIWA